MNRSWFPSLHFALAMTIIQLFLPEFNLVAMVDIRITELNNPRVWLAIVLFAVILGTIAGIYLAYYLTSARPVKLIKGGSIRDSEGSFFRATLMTLQFTISIIMIVALIASIKQLRYLRTVDLGFNKDQVLIIDVPETPDYIKDFSQKEAFRERLLNHPDIKKVAFSAGAPGIYTPTSSIEIDGETKAIGFFLIDEHYVDLMELEVIEGQSITKSRHEIIPPPGTTIPILLNESAVKQFGIDHQSGKSYIPALCLAPCWH